MNESVTRQEEKIETEKVGDRSPPADSAGRMCVDYVGVVEYTTKSSWVSLLKSLRGQPMSRMQTTAINDSQSAEVQKHIHSHFYAASGEVFRLSARQMPRANPDRCNESGCHSCLLLS
jgi:hypothetical protein